MERFPGLGLRAAPGTPRWISDFGEGFGWGGRKRGFVWTLREGAAGEELKLEGRPVWFGLEDSGSVWG